MRKKLIAPSILSADFANLEKEIQEVTAAGADWIHVDVMDGHFVNNLTIGVPVVSALKRVSKLPLDVHLMIEKPERYINQFIKAGADYLTIHVESTEDPGDVIWQIRSLGAKPGITLRPGTDIEKILGFLPMVDLVLVMTVEPGFGGQEFRTDQIDKINYLRKEIDMLEQNLDKKILLEVDGGINEKTAPLCAEADVFVAGSFIFGKKPYQTQIEVLKK